MQQTITSARESVVRAGRVTGVALALIHVAALAVFIPATFSWSGVAVCIGLYYLTGAFGITLNFHRVLTHRSLKLWKPLEYATAILGTLALQGGPIEWVSTHRKHHAHTDADGDPHDVHRGLGWAHVEWLYRRNDARLLPDEQLRLAADLASDPFYVWLEQNNRWLQVALCVALFAAGSLFGGWLGGISWLVWGGFVRVVLTYHITWLVNSAAHHVGYRTFKTGDLSTNNWWVAFLAWGEGWHNNHHAFPFSARHGLRWFEIDMTWITIRVLAALKLARDIKLPTPAMVQRLRLAPQEIDAGA